jgi:hypothetical protein
MDGVSEDAMIVADCLLLFITVFARTDGVLSCYLTCILHRIVILAHTCHSLSPQFTSQAGKDWPGTIAPEPTRRLRILEISVPASVSAGTAVDQSQCGLAADRRDKTSE